MGEVKVHRLFRSPFSWRVELALKLKGIEYEMIEEDLKNKSDELIKYNPIHKMIPVLVHDGKPVVESLVILEYIDEIWKENALLPSHPYERAQARFWAKFIDDKLFPSATKVKQSQGDEVEKAKEEYYENLKMFEKEIEGKKFLGGNAIGYLDIVGLLICYWIPIYQEIVGLEVMTKDKFPGIFAWADGLLGHPFMIENLPNREELVDSYRSRFTPS